VWRLHGATGDKNKIARSYSEITGAERQEEEEDWAGTQRSDIDLQQAFVTVASSPNGTASALACKSIRPE
jgi:hypothetical protein